MSATWTAAEWEDTPGTAYAYQPGFEHGLDGSVNLTQDGVWFWVIRGVYPRFETPEICDCEFEATKEAAMTKVEEYIAANTWDPDAKKKRLKEAYVTMPEDA